MIKAIIFDWGGVLIENHDKERYEIMAKTFKTSYKKFTDYYSKVNSALTKGLVEESKFWASIAQFFNTKILSNRRLEVETLMATYKENTDIIELVKLIKKKGYKIVLLSNTDEYSARFFLDKYPDLFNKTIFSCRVHSRKPEKEIYLKTLDILQLNSDEMVFIDDKQINIDVAKELGFNTILFINTEQFKADLNKFLQ